MPARSQGFTLIEIAIVLVIAGLLLGGALKGKELITSAKVRSLNDRITSVTAAWFAFQDRYRAIPGDYIGATTTIPSTPSLTITNGDGNGVVQDNAERPQAWNHLAGAGLITGSYINIPFGPDYGCRQGSCLDNGFGQGMVLTYAALAANSTAPANELLSGGGIPSSILAELDRKTDDGNASTGTMTLGEAAWGFDGAQRTACLETGSNTAYAFTNPSGYCAAVFRNLY